MTEDDARAHVAAEVELGEQALRAAQELLRLRLPHDSLSRAYYAAAHFARALLLTEGVEPKTHVGVSRMFGMHFVRPGRITPERAKDLARLEQLRAEADYNRFFVLTPEGAAEEVDVALRFCAELRDWLARHSWIGAEPDGGS